MIRTITVDDEKHARDRLGYMLREQEDIELLANCENGIEAIQIIHEQKPDLVFLDIEMPEVNGFDVLSSLEPDEIPIIVFVTAFSEYAVKAFEVNALDYVHKPFDKNRLSKSIEKVRGIIQNNEQSEVQKKIEEFLKTRQEEEKIKRFVLKTGGSIYIVKTSDVQWIEASGNYVNIITDKKKHLFRSTLSGLLKKLDEKNFYQIHRSTIINLDYVERIEEWIYGDYKVIMKNGEELKMSRNYKGLIHSF